MQQQDQPDDYVIW